MNAKVGAAAPLFTLSPHVVRHACFVGEHISYSMICMVLGRMQGLLGEIFLYTSFMMLVEPV